MRTLFTITLLVGFAVSAAAQQGSSQARAQEIAASFNKFKNVAKEKYGVRKEKYKDVRCEPAVRQNTREYAGVYEVPDLGYAITIQVGNDGHIQASGYESDSNHQARNFRLEDAKISGALLTGNKLYDNGVSEKFEGVFLNRTDRNSPTDSGVTLFGLGVLLNPPREQNGLAWDKLFYQLK